MKNEIMGNTVEHIKKTERNSSFELLRIIAMIFIILSHSSVHGNFPEEDSTVWFNNIFLDWFVLGNVGVDIFVILSGYFLCEKKKQTLLPLIAQVWFYSVICLTVYGISGNKISKKELAGAIFPTLFEEYWFFTAYVILCLFLPFINLFLQHVSRKMLKKCIIIMVCIWCIVPLVIDKRVYKVELLQFLLLYLIGAYLRKYPLNVFASSKIRNTLTLVSFGMLFSSSVMLRLVFNAHELHFYDQHSIIVLGCALGLVAIAKYHDVFVNKKINGIAGCTFGIYLLHDNPFIRCLLWNQWLPNYRFYNSKYLFLIMLASVILVFTVGTILELFRKKLIAKPLLKFFNCGYSIVSQCRGRLCNFLKNILKTE